MGQMGGEEEEGGERGEGGREGGRAGSAAHAVMRRPLSTLILKMTPPCEWRHEAARAAASAACDSRPHTAALAKLLALSRLVDVLRSARVSTLHTRHAGT